MRRDYVREAIELAVKWFDGDGLFNSANFGIAICKVAGMRGSVDGKLVSTILLSRRDVEHLPGGAHWRYRPSLWRRIVMAIRGPGEG